MFFPIEITDQIVTYFAEDSKAAGWFKNVACAREQKLGRVLRSLPRSIKQSIVAVGGGRDVHTGAA